MFIAGSVGIGAVIVFLCIVLLAYISVTVPISVLRLQLMQTVGSHKKPSKLLRFLSRFTQIFWLADISAIIRAIRLLSLCYKLNKKYVPSHVLRSRARILLQTKKSHVLDDIFNGSCSSIGVCKNTKDWNGNTVHDDMNIVDDNHNDNNDNDDEGSSNIDADDIL